MFISPTNITTGVGTTPGKADGTLISGGKGAQGFILDQYPNADVAFALRRLSTAYNGPMFRGRRATDSIEVDVHFDSTGSYSLESPIDNASDSTESTNVGDFVGNLRYPDPDGVDGGTDLWMSKWYDQSGNGRDGTSTTTSKQPRMAYSGDLSFATGMGTAGCPCGYLDGGNNVLVAEWGTIAPPNTVTQVGQQLTHTTNRYWWTGTTSSTRNEMGSYWSGNDSGLYAGGDGGDAANFLVIDDSNTIAGSKIRYALWDSANSAFSLTDDDGNTTDIYGSIEDDSQYGARLFAYYSGSGSYNMYGYFNEIIFWPANITASVPLLSANIINQLNSYYQIN
tara:strand:- start:116 stop:1129 length:1014 start_codon:yes stop_codon:yes gene_type:complete